MSMQYEKDRQKPNTFQFKSQPGRQRRSGQSSPYSPAEPSPLMGHYSQIGNRAAQRLANPYGIPEPIKNQMESTFQTDFSDVTVTPNSSRAPQLGALAYTQGNEIHFAPGMYNPHTSAGQRLLGHELTHVEQYRQGRVKPTRQLNGVAINDSPDLEKEADSKSNQAIRTNNQYLQTKNNLQQNFLYYKPVVKNQNNLQSVINTNKTTTAVQLFASTELVNLIKPGSPETYLVKDWFVKKWKKNGEQKSLSMFNIWREWDEKLFLPEFKRERLTDSREWVFAVKKCKGTNFFQHSKQGHKSTLREWLNGIDDLKRLRELKRLFSGATMGDPQGFYSDTAGWIFEFIDLQKPGAGQMTEYADYIDTLINNLTHAQ